MKIGLLGSTGYFGANILNSSGLKNIEAINRSDFDLENNLNFSFLDKYDCIINCAGKVNQNLAELDNEYRRSMYKVNSSSPVLIRNKYKGYFVHISSYFIIDPYCSEYCNSKHLSHVNLRERENTLIVVPAHPYGGINSKNYYSFLQNSLNKKVTLDNMCKFNIIEMTKLISAISFLVKEKETGTVLIYENGVYDKYSMAIKLFGERENWNSGPYERDIAKRPKNATFDMWSGEIAKDYVYA